jgi:uncharacterized protein YcnI
MRRAVIAAILATAVGAPPAQAHVTTSPTQLTVGVEQALSFNVPVDGIDPVTEVDLKVPAAYEIETIEAKPGWTVTRTQVTVQWRGGSIPTGDYASFGVTGTANRTGRIAFAVDARRGVEHDTFVVPVKVVAPATAARQRDTSARTLGKAALFVAIAAGAVALAAFFLALALWLRGPRSLQES